MSFLIDTDLLSLLEPKRVPPKLAVWVQEHEAQIFLSVISFAELQFGLDQAPASHQTSLAVWLAETRRTLAPATEQLTEPVLVRWKRIARGPQGQKPHNDVRRLLNCGHSSFPRPHPRYAQQATFRIGGCAAH